MMVSQKEEEVSDRRSFMQSVWMVTATAAAATFVSPPVAMAKGNCMAECLRECKAIAPKVQYRTLQYITIHDSTLQMKTKWIAMNVLK